MGELGIVNALAAVRRWTGRNARPAAVREQPSRENYTSKTRSGTARTTQNRAINAADRLFIPDAYQVRSGVKTIQ